MAARGREAAKKARELTRKKDSMSVGTPYLDGIKEMQEYNVKNVTNYIPATTKNTQKD